MTTVDKNYNMIITEKQQKYQNYHLEKLINKSQKQLSEIENITKFHKS